ncbi:MAG TPA: hypothetical protein DIC52_01400 [Candidatus Latescibacteria bacterium]|nr:hypothetical protein [Candidatus Latescibacterota bacterium]
MTESGPTRFGAPSDGLQLVRLYRETRRISYFAFALAMLVVAGTLGYFMALKKERPAPKPLSMEFIIRKPMAKKPFRMRKTQVQKRQITRKLVTSKPKLARTPPRSIRRNDALGNVATFAHQIDVGTSVGTSTVTPQLAAMQIRSSKDPEKRISMQEEFLDLNALDTGKYRGMVIQDPNDRTNIRGFVYLALAWGNDLQPDAPRSVSKLAEGINEYTGIQAKVADHMFLDSPELFRTPFVYITDKDGFELTDKEIESLGEYMRSGGFVFADNDRPDLNFGPAEASLRAMFGQALGRDGKLERIPNSHPIFHSFFDLDGPPVGGEYLSVRGNPDIFYLNSAEQTDVYYQPDEVQFLEGVFVDGRLVAVYSDMGYGSIWQDEFENEPQLRMGVNLVVFALTQEGSIAQQQIDFYTELTE